MYCYNSNLPLLVCLTHLVCLVVGLLYCGVFRCIVADDIPNVNGYLFSTVVYLFSTVVNLFRCIFIPPHLFCSNRCSRFHIVDLCQTAFPFASSYFDSPPRDDRLRRQDKTRQDKIRQDKTRQDSVLRFMALFCGFLYLRALSSLLLSFCLSPITGYIFVFRPRLLVALSFCRHRHPLPSTSLTFTLTLSLTFTLILIPTFVVSSLLLPCRRFFCVRSL
jgi:hypothetical protein